MIQIPTGENEDDRKYVQPSTTAHWLPYALENENLWGNDMDISESSLLTNQNSIEEEERQFSDLLNIYSPMNSPINFDFFDKGRFTDSSRY
jgi:hypothetical protein